MQVNDELLLASCRECHARHFGEEVKHFPVSAGQCRDCHTLHRSTEPALLLMPLFETCIECHDEPEDLSEESHSQDGVEDCNRCHDPHFGSEYLLRPGVEAPGG
jgi:predicted CXXCH cytochrome family protein